MALHISVTVAFHPGGATTTVRRLHGRIVICQREKQQVRRDAASLGSRAVQNMIHNHAMTARAPSTGWPSRWSPSMRMSREARSAERLLENNFQAVSWSRLTRVVGLPAAPL